MIMVNNIEKPRKSHQEIIIFRSNLCRIYLWVILIIRFIYFSDLFLFLRRFWVCRLQKTLSSADVYAYVAFCMALT